MRDISPIAPYEPRQAATMVPRDSPEAARVPMCGHRHGFSPRTALAPDRLLVERVRALPVREKSGDMYLSWLLLRQRGDPDLRWVIRHDCAPRPGPALHRR